MHRLFARSFENFNDSFSRYTLCGMSCLQPAQSSATTRISLNLECLLAAGSVRAPLSFVENSTSEVNADVGLPPRSSHTEIAVYRFRFFPSLCYNRSAIPRLLSSSSIEGFRKFEYAHEGLSTKL